MVDERGPCHGLRRERDEEISLRNCWWHVPGRGARGMGGKIYSGGGGGNAWCSLSLYWFHKHSLWKDDLITPNCAVNSSAKNKLIQCLGANRVNECLGGAGRNGPSCTSLVKAGDKKKRQFSLLPTEPSWVSSPLLYQVKSTVGRGGILGNSQVEPIYFSESFACPKNSLQSVYPSLPKTSDNQ